jgi:hypothetical protein
MVRTLVGLGTISACVLAYALSAVNPVEAVVLPVVLMGAVVLSIALLGRARSRREWSAAWDAYAQREVSDRSLIHVLGDDAISWAAPN